MFHNTHGLKNMDNGNGDTFDEYDYDGYSDEYVVKEKKFTNAKFQNARKQYIKSYKALLKIVK